ncbi:arabinose-5-phosphate isomerase [Zhouia amylolytica]|uniref:KpsF/GutQ family protein n=2 Tax=Zhouia amylolytica TaxID=376730 RepID=W2URS2_9FLAO|nr:KpsF/GutQ family sugar-phosphate isomerase [Zhouia amylolytica]ETN96017.1 kpsF/GutQ family protein [Zhouia amylolytica AD3]MCQ0111305.1 KpsF/GutQ family sugar-phosphate isomerase [Zhouia amylolytica]SFS50848.1 arabinose-5-phosphate isomerase [Zhouia amylolytica]
MKRKDTIIATAKKAIDTECEAIQHLSSLVDEDFANAIEFIYNSKGRVVVTGIGKSAIIATKIVATLNSTGTPAIFMHAADAIHGDLGTIQQDDVIICISKSGNTPEIKVLVPLLKNGPNKLIAITGNKDSFLGQQADFILNAHVEKEACPNNLAPTSSTTAQLVIGDALAICLLELKEFGSKDFAKYHPGGALGKKLYLRVHDISEANMKPQVKTETPIKDVIVEITEKRLGVAPVTDDNGKIVGIITDGDIRRMLNKYDEINGLKACDIMSENPKTIEANAMAVDALEHMEANGISQLLVEKKGKYAGVIHLHDLIKEGII